jgi:transcriptional regulator
LISGLLCHNSWYVADDVNASLPLSSLSGYPEMDVPTWNYAVVHVYGRIRRNTEMTHQHSLDQLVGKYELPSRYTSAAAVPAKKLAPQRLAIVGFTIDIERIEGKFKLSQNKPRHVQERIIKHLRHNGHADMANIMAKELAIDL